MRLKHVITTAVIFLLISNEAFSQREVVRSINLRHVERVYPSTYNLEFYSLANSSAYPFNQNSNDGNDLDKARMYGRLVVRSKQIGTNISGH